MAELKNKFSEIVNDIEKNLKNTDDAEYVKKQICKMYTIFEEEINRLEKKTVDKVDSLLIRYKVIEGRMNDIEDTIDKIETDIYIDNNENDDYEFDITCPYCESEFAIDLSEGTQNKVSCPECNKTIELDWNEDEYKCGHDCGGCGNGSCGNHNQDEEIDEDM